MPHFDSTANSRHREPSIELAMALVATLLALLTGCAPAAPTPPPARLADTGLYRDFTGRGLAPDVLAYAPQYPLWTDGAAKRRWIALPAGAAIDGSDVDCWQFPVGTRLWKEFAFAGRPVETRFLQRQAAGWLYASYLWNDDGSDAVLAPDAGVRGVCPTGPGTRHDVPAAADCRLCHEGGRSPVLGFTALQLSPDRDPLAPHADALPADAVDLPALVDRGLLLHLDPRWLRQAPRITAANPTERAALGYLHSNCGTCHNPAGPLARLDLDLACWVGDGSTPAIATAVGQPSRFQLPATTGQLRLAAGDPAHSVLLARLAATDPIAQMPPLGRHCVDVKALDLLSAWVRDLRPSTTVSVPPNHKENQ